MPTLNPGRKIITIKFKLEDDTLIIREDEKIKAIFGKSVKLNTDTYMCYYANFTYDLNFIKDFIECSRPKTIESQIRATEYHKDLEHGDDKLNTNLSVKLIEDVLNSYLNNADIHLDHIICEEYSYGMRFSLFVDPKQPANKRQFHIISSMKSFNKIYNPAKTYVFQPRFSTFMMVEVK